VDGELTRAGILEALLFVAEEPLALGRLQEALGDEDPAVTEASVRELALALERDERGLMVQEVAGGFRLSTRPEAHAWIQRLQQVKPARLSRPALETLAIVAYRQPITRAEIEKIRGVAADGVIRTLLERELIRILGRKAEAGRPIVYGTSTAFLEHFGFRELGDLPTLKEIDELLGTPPPGAAVADGAQAAAGEPAGTSQPADLSPHAGSGGETAGPPAAVEPASLEPAEPPR
jgi:segregation and condensation protein B